MANPTCSTTCEGELAPVLFDDCNPVVEFSEIRRVFVAKDVAAPFTNWTVASEWIARMSADSVSGNDYIRVLQVIGDRPAPAGVVKQISNGRTLTIGKDITLNLTIDDISDANYNFARQLECGGKVKIWYETEGGRMYGGNEGIRGNLTFDSVLNRGREEIASLNGVFTARRKFTEERAISPIYDGDNANTSGPATFDTLQTFAVGTTDTDHGVGSTVPATDADLKFEFNAINPRSGASHTMIIQIGGVTKNTVVYTADYDGTYFKFTDTAGVAHVGNFYNGTLNFD